MLDKISKSPKPTRPLESQMNPSTYELSNVPFQPKAAQERIAKRRKVDKCRVARQKCFGWDSHIVILLEIQFLDQQVEEFEVFGAKPERTLHRNLTVYPKKASPAAGTSDQLTLQKPNSAETYPVIAVVVVVVIHHPPSIIHNPSSAASSIQHLIHLKRSLVSFSFTTSSPSSLHNLQRLAGQDDPTLNHTEGGGSHRALSKILLRRGAVDREQSQENRCGFKVLNLFSEVLGSCWRMSGEVNDKL